MGREDLILLFCSLECFNSWRVGGDELGQRVLFRTCWNLILVSHLFYCWNLILVIFSGLIQGWWTQVSLRFNLFVSDVNQGNRNFPCKKVDSRFSSVAPEMEMFSLYLPWAVKKICFGSGMWGCVEFIVAGWSKEKNFFDFLIKNWDKQWKFLLLVIIKCCLCLFDL